jgi:hypothetical protein
MGPLRSERQAPASTVKVCKGGGGITPLILNLATSWRCWLHAPAAQPPAMDPQYLEPVWTLRREKFVVATGI